MTLPWLPDDLAAGDRDLSEAERTFRAVQRHGAQDEGGGHFRALQEPDLLADELRAFFRPFR
jgi:hypothetical protein